MVTATDRQLFSFIAHGLSITNCNFPPTFWLIFPFESLSPLSPKYQTQLTCCSL
jgi:hypothetical protein